ncbi:MAG: hypothetical protein JWO72_2502 [Caulobacteraceae bacterium]|nr:hypothetical protein [Caulobacteraceae bacterium]
MPAPTAAEVLGALSTCGREACPDMARRVAREILAFGCVDRAAAALAEDDAHDLLSHLLAYRAAVAELADPALRIARLKREAADLDARAEPSWAEAAEFAGKAAFRRLQGESDLASTFLRRAAAAEQTAAVLEARAFAKRLEAAALQASATGRDSLSAALKTIAA